MKLKFLLVCSWLFLSVGTAQNFPIDEGTGKITYINTVSCEPLSASEIYKTAKEWATTQNLSLTTDQTDKKLIFNGSFKVSYRPAKGTANEESTVNYELHIGAKDEKYRYILVDLVH